MLNEQQKEFIRKSYKSVSVRQIAKYLNISRADAGDFVKTLEKVPSVSIFSKYKIILLPLSLSFVLIIHFALRFNTFWLAHYRGDQNQYTGLAMKIQHFGMKGYTLRGIDVKPYDEENNILAMFPSEDEEGDLIRGFKSSGSGYYDIPFFHKGPAFSIAIFLSHQIFSRNKDYLLVYSHLGKEVFKRKPKEFFFSQFYAVIIPLFFSMMLMLLTLSLGKMSFSGRIGIYAAFMLAVNPVSILTAHKIWADDMLAAFVALSALLFLIAQSKQNAWFSFFSGICCGIAVLAKQTGILISGAILLYSLFINIDKIKDIKKWPFLFIDKHLISFGLGMVITCAPWFYKVYRVYGDPLYQPVTSNIDQTDTTGWFAMLKARPGPLKLFSIGIPYMSPPFVFVYAAIYKLMTTFWTSLKKQDAEGKAVVFYWLWILAFMVFFVRSGGGDEHRRMLPAYPAIAILSAYFIDKLRLFAEKLFKNQTTAEILVLALLTACAFWSAPIGLSVVLDNGALIMKPF
ncbi:MAG: glycosyltransferase family 39 protein [Candidatus Omnitrophica bacterium]|nr:glycosyltransferase family 39 protein [Candidatus Omnitrophota bacterium]